MKDKIKGWLRPTGKVTDQIIIAFFLTIVMMIAGWYLEYYFQLVVPVGRLYMWLTSSEEVSQFIYEYSANIGIWAVFLLVCFLFKNNRPILQSIAPGKHGNTLKLALFGVALGFGSNGLCILMSVLLGNVRLSFHGFDPVMCIVFVVAVTIQSGAEELLCRVYLYQKLRRRYKNVLVAMIGNAALFAILHLMNAGITVISVMEILISGISYSLLVYYYDSPWAAIMSHATWNFTQNILFGLPNSGMEAAYSFFKSDTASATNGFFFDTVFGVEGNVGTVMVEAAFMVALILINRGKKEKRDLWGDTTENDMEEDDCK